MAGLIGDYSMSMRRSIKLMSGRILWTIGLNIGAILPAMALHYALNYGAMGRPVEVAAGMLFLDGILVGYLAALMAATFWVIYRRRMEAGENPGKSPV